MVLWKNFVLPLRVFMGTRNIATVPLRSINANWLEMVFTFFLGLGGHNSWLSHGF